VKILPLLMFQQSGGTPGGGLNRLFLKGVDAIKGSSLCCMSSGVVAIGWLHRNVPIRPTFEHLNNVSVQNAWVPTCNFKADFGIMMVTIAAIVHL